VIASLLLATYSVLSLVTRPEDRLFPILHPIETRLDARNYAVARAGRRAYASRLREDAVHRNEAGDFDNAYARLLDAAKWDPEGDQAAPVQAFRAERG
jgi:hypothetical protein